MNKTEFVAKLAERTEIEKKKSEEIVNAVLDIIKEAVVGGDTVQFVGFGTFGSAVRDSRQARNPQSGEMMIVPAKRVPTFKFGKTFKDEVRG